MVFSDYIADFLTSLIFSYSEKLNKDDVDLSISKTEIKMKNVELVHSLFIQYGFPLSVRRGLIESITAFIQKKGFVLILKNLFLHFDILTDNFPTVDELRSIRDRQLFAHELFKAKIGPLLNNFLLSSTFADQMKELSKKIRKASLRIENLHILIQNKNVKIGAFIEAVEIFDVKKENGIVDLPSADDFIERNLKICKIKIIISENNNIDENLNDENESFQEMIKRSLNVNNSDEDNSINNANIDFEEDNIIYKNDIIEGKVFFRGDKIEIEINDEKENVLNIKDWQIEPLLHILKRTKQFHNYYLIRKIPRPKNFYFLCKNSNENLNMKINSNENDNVNYYDDDISMMENSWLFFHRCAIKINQKNDEKSEILGSFVNAFKNRRRYSTTWQNNKKPPFNPTELDELDHSLSYNQIILFRCLTERMRKKWTHQPLNKEDVNFGLRFIDLDFSNMLNSLIQKLLIKANFLKLLMKFEIPLEKICLKRANSTDSNQDLFGKNPNDVMCFHFSMIHPSFNFSYDKLENLIISFSFTSLKLKNNNKEEIIESVDNGTRGFNVEITKYKYPNVKIQNEEGEISDVRKSIKMLVDIKNEIFGITLESFRFLSFYQIVQSPNSQDETIRKIVNFLRNRFLKEFLNEMDFVLMANNVQLMLLLPDRNQISFVFDEFSLMKQIEKKLIDGEEIVSNLKNLSMLIGKDVEKVFITNFSVHTLLKKEAFKDKIRQELLIFISPIFGNFNWNDVKELKILIADTLNYFKTCLPQPITNNRNNKNGYDKEKTNTFLLSLLKELGIDSFIIDGGIPTVNLSIDLPTKTEKLVGLNINTIKFSGTIKKLNIFIDTLELDDLFFSKNINCNINIFNQNEKMNIVIDKTQFSMFRSLSIVPKDLFHIIKMSKITYKFSFLVKTLSVDLGVPSIADVVDYTVSNFGGYVNEINGQLELECNVNYINLNHKPLILDHQVEASIEITKKAINIYVTFGDINFIFQHDFLNFIFNSEWNMKDIFPKNFVLNWNIEIKSVVLEPLINYAKNIKVYLVMSETAFGGDVNVEQISIFGIKTLYECFDKDNEKDFISKSNESQFPISLSVDLPKHYFSASINFDYMEIDILKFFSLLQYFLHFPFHILIPITLDIQVLPLTINCKIGENDSFTFNSYSELFFNGDQKSISFQMRDFEIWFNDVKIIDLPCVDMFGIEAWKCTIPNLNISLENEMILPIMNAMKKIPSLSFEFWPIQHSMQNIPIEFIVDSIDLILNDSFVLSSKLLANYLNNIFMIGFDSVLYYYSTWFSCIELLSINEGKLNVDLMKKLISCAIENPIKSQIRPDELLSTFQLDKNRSFLDNSTTLKPRAFLSIENQTNLDFKSDFGDIKKKSLFQFNEFFADTEFEIECEFGKIPIKRDNFFKKGKMNIIFPNNQQIVFLLNYNNTVLKICPVFKIKNQTLQEMKFNYKDKEFLINPNTTIYPGKVTKEFKINDQSYQLDQDSIFFSSSNESQKSVVLNNKLGNNYIVTINKRKIIIKPLFEIQNDLPFNVNVNDIMYKANSRNEFRFYDNQINEVEPENKSETIINKKTIKINNEFIAIQSFELSLNKRFDSIKLETTFGFPFILRVQLIDNVFIFSSTIILRSYIRTMNFYISPDKIHRTILSSDDDTGIAFSPHKKLRNYVYLAISNESEFAEINVNEGVANGEEHILTIRSKEYPNIVFPFIYTCNLIKYKYFNTSYVEIKPYVIIENKLDSNLIILNSTEQNRKLFKNNINDKTELNINELNQYIKSNEYVELVQCNSNFHFNFAIGNPQNALCNDNNLCLSLNTISSQTIKFRDQFLPIKIDVSKKPYISSNNDTYIVKTLSFSISNVFPYRIVNFTNNSIFIAKNEIPANSAILYAPKNVLLNDKENHSNQITLNDSNCKFNIGQIGFQDNSTYEENNTGHRHYYYQEIHSLSDFQKESIVSESKESILSNQLFPFKLICEIISIDIDLLDDNQKTQINLNEIVFVMNNEMMSQINFSLNSLTIQDMDNNRILVSSLSHLNDDVLLEDVFFIRASIELFNLLHIHSIDVSVNPFYFFFDFSSFSFYLSSLLKNFEGIKAVMSSKQDSLFMMKGGLIDQLNISDIIVLFSFNCSNRLSSDFPQYLRLLPSINPTHINIDSMQINNLRPLSRSNGNKKMSFIHGKKLFLAKTFFKIFGSLNILGSPYSLIDRLFLTNIQTDGIVVNNNKRGIKQKIKLVFAFVFGFFENYADYIRSVFHYIGRSDNPPKDNNSPVLWGITSLLFAFLSGLSVILKNLREKKLIIGLVFGLIQFFFTCLGGCFDSLSGILCFLSSLFDESQHNDNIKDI